MFVLDTNYNPKMAKIGGNSNQKMAKIGCKNNQKEIFYEKDA
jgi:hypothetical protein